MNIDFKYLCRDAGNYKRFGSVVVSNRRALKREHLETEIIKALIDGAFFEASQVDLPPLFFESFPFDPLLDHGWHEFGSIDDTSAVTTDPSERDVLDLIDQLTRSRQVINC